MAGAQVRLRPAKGIHLVYERRITNVALTAEAVDGRGLLLVPHTNQTLLGTTDDDYYGDAENLEVTDDEVEYVLQAMERVFPSIRRHRIAHANAAVRPTLHRWRPYEDDLSRDYAVFDHAARDGVAQSFLSGGLDSRCITAALKALGKDVATVAFDVSGSPDRAIAGAFAELVGTRHAVEPCGQLGDGEHVQLAGDADQPRAVAPLLGELEVHRPWRSQQFGKKRHSRSVL